MINVLPPPDLPALLVPALGRTWSRLLCAIWCASRGRAESIFDVAGVADQAANVAGAMVMPSGPASAVAAGRHATRAGFRR